MKLFCIFYVMIFFFSSQNIFAASVVELQCDVIVNSKGSFFERAKNLFKKNIEFEYEKLILAQGLRIGHTKSSSKLGIASPGIFFDFKTKKLSQL